MPKLDLSRALRIKGAAGEVAQLKGPGFSWQTRLAWSPARLFEKGEVGAWFDPTEISTLFQDSAGVSGVSAAGQVAGLALDKSKRLVLGPELVTNGDFSNGSTGWTAASSAVLSASDGSLVVTNGGTAFGYAWQAVSTVVGRTYTVTFSVTGGTSTGNLFIGTTIGGFENYNSPNRSVGVYVVRFVATAATTYLRVGLSSNTVSATCNFDNISVRELPGFHATAAGTKLPTYGIVPKGGRRNDLTNTGLQGAVVGTPGTAPTGWQIGFATGSISAVAADAALGGNSVTVSATAARQFLQQNFNAAANTIWTLSADVVLSQTTQVDTCIVFAAAPVGATQTFFLNGVQVSKLTQIPAGAHKVAVQLIVGANAGAGIQARVGIGCSGLATGSVKVMNPQREAGAVATAYQLAVSQFDVREAGVQSLAYLYDDLVDDALTWVAPAGVYTIAYVDTSAAVTILSGQALSGATDVLLPRQLGGYVAVNRSLTALEADALTACLAAKMGG